METRRNLARETIKAGPSCTSNDFTEHHGEDCLYLNIFAPKAVLRESRKVPVGVWIHGGAFSGGSGSALAYDARFMAPESDMIIVTINYRLGALGFLMWNHIEGMTPIKRLIIY